MRQWTGHCHPASLEGFGWPNLLEDRPKPFKRLASTTMFLPAPSLGFLPNLKGVYLFNNWRFLILFLLQLAIVLCLFGIMDQHFRLQPCRCPLCRHQISLLVPGEASLRRCHDPQVAEILGKVETYNRLFSGHTNGLIQDLPFFPRRLL